MVIPSPIGNLLHRLLPRGLVRFLHRLYDPYHRWDTGRHSRKIINKLFPSGKLEVMTGPLAGLKCFPLSHGSALVPKLIGAYEAELYPVLVAGFRKRYTTVIDVGCAEGFYVVGCALKLPQARVHGFDLDRKSLAACKRLAELNQVADRIILHERCTHDDLARLIDDRTLIICDCEGFEVELLDPVRVPALRRADILVELHDRLVLGASKTVTRRFPPQRVTMIQSRDRNPSDYPLLATLSASDQNFAVDEFRGGPMEWAFIEGVAKSHVD
jgi:hypothetical protein